MMKILHTSDWHLGHTLYDFDRNAEQKDFFNQLSNIVAEEKPDVMVVSGDIYHTPMPSVAAQKLYTDGLLQIHQAYPQMDIVVTAGNHDSSSKLEINVNLWDVVNVKVVGTFESQDGIFNLDKHIIDIKNQEGQLIGYVVAIPFSYPNNFPVLHEDTTRELRQKHFFQSILHEVQVRNSSQLPVVLMAHLSVTGCDMTGHNEVVGGIEYFNIDEFGVDFDYMALGHIHCPQTLKNSNNKARYSGSPLPISFDENYPHSITIVELEKDTEPQIKIRNIRNSKPLLTIPKEPSELEEAFHQLEKNIRADEEAYIRLNLLVKDHLPPDVKERASDILREKKAKLCVIKETREFQSEEDLNQPQLTLDKMQEVSPLEIAQRFYQQKHGMEMEENLVECMKTVIQQLQQEEQA